MFSLHTHGGRKSTSPSQEAAPHQKLAGIFVLDLQNCENLVSVLSRPACGLWLGWPEPTDAEAAVASGPLFAADVVVPLKSQRGWEQDNSWVRPRP